MPSVLALVSVAAFTLFPPLYSSFDNPHPHSLTGTEWVQSILKVRVPASSHFVIDKQHLRKAVSMGLSSFDHVQILLNERLLPGVCGRKIPADSH